MKLQKLKKKILSYYNHASKHELKKQIKKLLVNTTLYAK